MLVCGFVLWGMPHLTMAIGDVKVEREGVVQSVVAGFELQENDVVITGPFSKAIIELDNGGKISLDENTRLAVETLNGSDSVFDVHRGRILAKLVKKKGLRFKFKTPVGVAGVRGTELAISVDKKSSKVYVFNGLVDFKTIKGHKLIKAGRFAKAWFNGKILSPKRIPGGVRRLILRRLAYDRSILLERKLIEQRKIAKIVKKAVARELIAAYRRIQIAKALANAIRDADYKAGRVMKDVHGNVVLVAQALLRPDPETVTFVDVVFRKNYTYKGFLIKEIENCDFGPKKFRLDVAAFEIGFSKPLPAKVREWPTAIYNYIEAEEDFKVLYTELLITNLQDGIVQRNYFHENETETEFKAICDGEEHDIILAELGDPAYQEIEGEMWGGTSLAFAVFKIPVYVDFNDNGVAESNELVQLNMEYFLINNSGNIMTVQSLIETAAEDPIQLILGLAFEVIISESTDKWMCDPVTNTKRNIDLVFIPDLPVILSVELITGIVDLTKGLQMSPK